MGSKRKKAEKQKDFNKKKLKVGKTASKPDNHTDTSFKAKMISLPNQQLNKSSNGGNNSLQQELDLNHYLSLTKHHSDSTRKQVVIHLQTILPSNPSLYKQLLNSIIPMIHDSNFNVQSELIILFNKIGEKQPGLLSLHIKSVVLFILSAMTHIQPIIRSGSTKFLQVLIDHAGSALIKSFFIKIMKNYFHLLNWTLSNDKKSMSLAITTGSSIGGTTKKARIGHLHTLNQFLKLAIFEPQISSDVNKIDFLTTIMIHPLSYKYLIADIPQPFTSLKLFTTELTSTRKFNDVNFNLNDLDDLSADDLQTRRKVMEDVFLTPILNNLNCLIKEGGEVGKEAHSLLSLLQEFQQTRIKDCELMI